MLNDLHTQHIQNNHTPRRYRLTRLIGGLIFSGFLLAILIFLLGLILLGLHFINRNLQQLMGGM